MRLRETYNDNDYLLMLKGFPISFMMYISNRDDVFYNDINGIYSGYFLHSNYKKASPILQEYVKNDVSFIKPIEFYNDSGFNISQKLYRNSLARIELDQYLVTYVGPYTIRVRGYRDNRLYYTTYTTEFIFDEYEYNVDYVLLDIGLLEGQPEGFLPIPYDEIINNYSYYINANTMKISSLYYVAELIRSKYLKKWTDTYNILATEFDPLNDFKRTEENSGKDKTSLKHGKTISKSIEDRVSLMHGEEIKKEYTNRGNENTREYTNYSITNENINQNEGQDYVFGFNSSSEVSTDKSITKDASKDVTTYNGTYKDKTSMNGIETDKHSGTDTTSRATTDRQSNTGTDEDTTEYGKKIEIDGYNENPTRNLQKALDFHAKNIFYDIIYDDIDSIVTLSIY